MKYALVTGASRGIGKAIAICLAKAGYPVIINYLKNEEAAALVAEEIEQQGGKAELLPFDTSCPEAIEAALERWEEGHPDDYIYVLVNNAGITKDTLLMRMTDEQFDDVLNTNLKSCFKLCLSSLHSSIVLEYAL